MAYQTASELVNQFQAQTILYLSDDLQTGTMVEARVLEAIGKAADLIDAWLSNKFTLPIAVVPGIIKKLSGDIALYELYARRPDIETPAGVSDRYKAALKLLEQFASGKIQLAGAVSITQTGGSSGIASNAKAKILMDKLEQF